VQRPSDDVLRALGRLTWAAINAENRARAIVETIFGGGPELGPIGTALADAINRLTGIEQEPAVLNAIAWLRSAEVALNARNTVMHSVPLVLFDRDSNGRRYESDRPALQYVPRRGGHGVRRNLTEAALDDVSQHLESLVDTWVPIREGLLDLSRPSPR
jgi:hypothetical protein